MRGAWYFRHDYSAKNDQKVIELEIEFGQHVGYSMWFRLLEAMGEAGGLMPKSKVPLYAITMRVDEALLRRFIGFCIEISLLDDDGNAYTNRRFSAEYNKIKNVSEKAAYSASCRKTKDKTNEVANDDPDQASDQEPKPKKPKTRQTKGKSDPESEEIVRLRGFAKAIYDDAKCTINLPMITTEEYQELLDRHGYDKLVVMQRKLFEWKVLLKDRDKHSDFRRLLNPKAWLLPESDKLQSNGRDSLMTNGEFL